MKFTPLRVSNCAISSRSASDTSFAAVQSVQIPKPQLPSTNSHKEQSIAFFSGIKSHEDEVETSKTFSLKDGHHLDQDFTDGISMSAVEIMIREMEKVSQNLASYELTLILSN